MNKTKPESATMTIPALDEHGLLPPGVHDASWEEVLERFGRFQRTDCRLKLCRNLREFLDEVRASHLVEVVILDGSFVTAKDEPGDVDLILVLRRDHDWSARLRPFEYNVVAQKQVRKRYPVDLAVTSEGSGSLHKSLGFFEQVRGMPGLRKGLLRLRP